MKKDIRNTLLLVSLLFASLRQQAQVLNVSVVNTGNNAIQIRGTATSPGFDSPPNNSWASMNITWRIPKSAAVPAPTVAPPAITPEITSENTAFTGASPRDAFNNTGLDLTVFDLTTFGQPDDGFWYFQVTGTTGNVQDIATGNSVVLYEFTTPFEWYCLSCVEVLVTDIPGLPISTTSFIDNAGLGQDVLNLVDNLGPLPVRFLGFEAHKIGNEVQLNWKVSNEENVKGYYVERSANGISWQTIGFVAFQSPVSVINNYSLTDQRPMNGINYYRIREEDIDGRTKYSVTRIVEMDRDAWIVNLYPVPVTDKLKLDIDDITNSHVTIKIIDLNGKVLLLRSAQLTRGRNLEEMDVRSLAGGIYFVEISSDTIKWTGKFIKKN